MADHKNQGAWDHEARDGALGQQVRNRFCAARRFFRRVSVVLISSVLATLFGEGLLRMLAPIPDDELITWEAEGHIRARPVPNQVIGNGSGHEIRINKYGFRGPDYSFVKEQGTLRLLVFGGSAGFNFWSAGRERTWPGALERMLAGQLAMPVEVINLALPGFDVFNSKINYLCFGRAFEADAVIVYHTWNDLKAFRHLEGEPYRAVKGVPDRSLYVRAMRATQIGRRLRRLSARLRRRGAENAYHHVKGTEKDIDRQVSDEAFAWERRNFLDFVMLVRADGRLPILVTQAGLASRENLDDDEIRYGLRSVTRYVGMTIPLALDSWLRVSRIIKEVADETGALFVDGYAAVPHDTKHFRDHVHLHDAGSEVLAARITEVLCGDDRFLEVVSRVRAETSTPSD